MVYLQLAAGLILLAVFGDVLVRGAVGVSRKLGIPSLVIGLTVVAFGTSAPELVVSLQAALSGSPGIALGNVVGSNIANVLLALGLPAIFVATRLDQEGLDRNTYFMLAVSVLFVGLCFFSPMNVWDSMLLLGLLLVFLWDTARRALRSKSAAVAGDEDVSALPGPVWFSSLGLLIGLVGLPFAANMTVDSASMVARTWGVSETAIGLTVVALGTSLPEITTTVLAAIRGHGGLALGNIVGSNVFNLLAITGLTAAVTPLPIPRELILIDVWVMLAASMALLPFVIWHLKLGRLTGVVFVSAYVGYIWVIFSSQNLITTASAFGP